jgi:hypothetical protein
MTATKISLLRLRQLINEEIKQASVNEAVDHKGINSIVNVASKLLAAVEAFKEKAPPSAIHAVTPHIAELEGVTEGDQVKMKIAVDGSEITLDKMYVREMNTTDAHID